MASPAVETRQTSTDTTQPKPHFNDKDWYQESVETIPEDERELLEQYSGLKPEEVIPHVVALRDKAFPISGYTCIGQLRFLSFHLRRLPCYEEVMTRLRYGSTFCDAGCCFGQELRWMASKGIPSEQLYGFDLVDDFVDLGYELFRDRDRFKATFAKGDILALPDSDKGKDLNKLVGPMDVIFCSSFLHCFDWDDMVNAVKRIISFSRMRPGSLVVGKQLGSAKAGSYKMPTSSGSMWRHDPESLARLWRQAGQETHTRWHIESEFYEGFELNMNMKQKWADPDQSMLRFKATRL